MPHGGTKPCFSCGQGPCATDSVASCCARTDTIHPQSVAVAPLFDSGEADLGKHGWMSIGSTYRINWEVRADRRMVLSEC